MKKVVFLLLPILFSFNVNAQSLNNNATLIKLKYPEAFKILKKHAVEKWNDNYEMIIYRINNQSDAVFSLIEEAGDEKTVPREKNISTLNNAILKWSYKGFESYNSKILYNKDSGLKGFLSIQCDWEMAKYEYGNQIKALKALY